MGSRQCPFCGKMIRDTLRECSFCHENLPPVPRTVSASTSRRGKFELRRGLLYMLGVAVIYYFLSSNSPVKLTVPFTPLLLNDVLPIFFAVSLGFALYGLFHFVRG